MSLHWFGIIFLIFLKFNIGQIIKVWFIFSNGYCELVLLEKVIVTGYQTPKKWVYINLPVIRKGGMVVRRREKIYGLRMESLENCAFLPVSFLYTC